MRDFIGAKKCYLYLSQVGRVPVTDTKMQGSVHVQEELNHQRMKPLKGSNKVKQQLCS